MFCSSLQGLAKRSVRLEIILEVLHMVVTAFMTVNNCPVILYVILPFYFTDPSNSVKAAVSLTFDNVQNVSHCTLRTGYEK